MEIVSKLLRTLTKVFSDADLFSNPVTIDLLSELYLMVPLLLLARSSNRLIRYWITVTARLELGVDTQSGTLLECFQNPKINVELSSCMLLQ